MAFKEKLKGAWRRVSNLDDETQSIRKKVDDRIPYKVISKKLKEIMEENVDVVGRRILIPNFYTIYFNESDRNMRLEVEDVMCNELKEELFHEMRKINPEQSKGDLVISINTDPAIEKGQFKVVHRMKKPSREEERLSLDKTASEIMPPPRMRMIFNKQSSKPHPILLQQMNSKPSYKWRKARFCISCSSIRTRAQMNNLSLKKW